MLANLFIYMQVHIEQSFSPGVEQFVLTNRHLLILQKCLCGYVSVHQNIDEKGTQYMFYTRM